MSDIIDGLAELEYGSRGSNVAENVREYVSEFDSLDELRNEFSGRNHVNEAVELENLYSGGALNCSVRTVGQVAYEQVRDLNEGSIHVQYEPWDVMGIEIPGNIPTENHIVYDGADDTAVYNWNHDIKHNEEFEIEDILGLRSINLLVEDRCANEAEAKKSFMDLKDKRPDSLFLDGTARALFIDEMSENLPRPLKEAYESVTSKLT
ncbi:MAG: hypothetical protein BRC26_00570 [Nanohaloarchaea archaeon QH_8_44_6]|nr:MAG: hypothetical protein BRC26_00570 [Nanohaloarchaea archaeon QH_8_44_6]